LRAGAGLRFRTPLWTRTAVTAIHGRPRVEEVELTDVDSGRTRKVACDTVVFTADWIPDHELAVMGGLDMDPGTRGPVVDTALRTSREGVFAAGNLLHGAEPADIAALSGRHAGAAAAKYLAGGTWPEKRVRIECEPPLHWIAPNAASLRRLASAAPVLATAVRPPATADYTEEPRFAPPFDSPPRDRFLLRSREVLTRPRIEVVQDGRILWAGRFRRLVPGRSTALPGAWVGVVHPMGGPVRVRLVARG
jgi:hypothetical protein